MYNQTIMGLINGSPQAREQMYYFLRQDWPQINEKTTVRFMDSYTVYIATTHELPVQAYKKPTETWASWRWGLFPHFPIDDPQSRWQYQRMVIRSLRRIPKLIWKWITGQMRATDELLIPEPAVETLHMKQFQVHERTGGRSLWENVEHHRLSCVYSPQQDCLYVYDNHNGAGRLRVEDRENLENSFYQPYYKKP